jgi:hypothetical protein
VFVINKEEWFLITGTEEFLDSGQDTGFICQIIQVWD